MSKILSIGAWGCTGEDGPDYLNKNLLEPLGLYCSGGKTTHYDDGTQVHTYCIYNSVFSNSNRILMYELSEEDFNKNLLKYFRKIKLEKLAEYERG